MEIQQYQAQKKGIVPKIMIVDDVSFNIEALKIIIEHIFKVDCKKHASFAFTGTEANNLLIDDI